MKTDFMKKCYDQFVTPQARELIRLNVGVANRIYEILEERGMTQKDFANQMGKSEAKVSRWLSGTHNFTTPTIANINAVLGENVLEVPQKPTYVFIPLPRTERETLPANPEESNRKYQSSYCYEINR